MMDTDFEESARAVRGILLALPLGIMLWVFILASLYWWFR